MMKSKSLRKKPMQLPLFKSLFTTGSADSILIHFYCYHKEMFVGKEVCSGCKDFREYKLGRCLHTFVIDN